MTPTDKPDSVDQQKVIDFITDPKTIAKAVEGSMEKRQAVIDNQSDWLDEVLDGFADAIQIYLYIYNQQGTVSPSDGAIVDKAHSNTKQAIQAKIDQAVLAGRIDELNEILDNHSSRTIHPLAPRHDNYIIDASYIEDRLAELKLKNGDKGNE
ncbi:MAG: hypothetical protein JWL86_6964 [Rhizobium sp.]|nr:hypothetical protein [Rhizobium sp.]